MVWRMRRAFIIGIGVLAAVGAVAAAPPASQWEIGPIIRGKNYSRGMPLHPEPRTTGWSFDFPSPDVRAGHVHYVTFDPGSLAGKSRIVVRYRVDAASGANFVPQENPAATATVSLMFQRRGDDWSARGRYEFYRWYAPASSLRSVAPGVVQMTVSLADPEWISVYGRDRRASPAAFEDALANTSRVGLVFGAASARGHGVFSTGPARFTLIDFKVI